MTPQFDQILHRPEDVIIAFAIFKNELTADSRVQRSKRKAQVQRYTLQHVVAPRISQEHPLLSPQTAKLALEVSTCLQVMGAQHQKCTDLPSA